MALKPSRILLIVLGAAVPGLTILDEATAQGDRLLVWAE